jgi:hypothetical protein
MSERVGGPKLDEAFVELESFSVAAFEGEVVRVSAERINVTGMPVQDAAEEIEFEIKLALIGKPGQVATDRG